MKGTHPFTWRRSHAPQYPRQNPVAICPQVEIPSRSTSWSNRNGIPSSGLSPISTDFISRPSSSITTGSARAEPSTHWCLSHVARSGKVGGVYGYIEQQVLQQRRYESCRSAAAPHTAADYPAIRAEPLLKQKAHCHPPHRDPTHPRPPSPVILDLIQDPVSLPFRPQTCGSHDAPKTNPGFLLSQE